MPPAAPAVLAAVENAMGACPPAALVRPAAVVRGGVAEPCAAFVCPAAVVRGGVAEPCAAFVCPAVVVRGGVAEPRRHWFALPLWCAEGWLNPCGTGSPCPGGEDHLKRRSSSPPVPPLLGYRHCPRRQTETLSRTSAARVQPRGCKGRSPLHKITLSPPLPAGTGVGGMGAGNKLK